MHIHIYICYPPPLNVDLFVGVTAICGVLCLLCALGKAAKKVPYLNLFRFYLETGKNILGKNVLFFNLFC